jgi:Na+-transporting methylmalonyl-CoA/oxaloacetate decarboxylase gamma subunit
MNLAVIVAVLVLLVAIIWAIAKAASSNRYANMTEEEFEAEAKRSSTLGVAVAGFQKIVDPSHKIELMQEQKQRIEADGAESGDRPVPGQPSAPKP